MRPAEALTHLTAVGVRLEVSGCNLLATPRESLTDEARALIRQHKVALVAALSSADAGQDPAPARDWRWSIVHADGSRAEHDFAPPANGAEIAAWYPDAQSIEPAHPKTSDKNRKGGT